MDAALDHGRWPLSLSSLKRADLYSGRKEKQADISILSESQTEAHLQQRPMDLESTHWVDITSLLHRHRTDLTVIPKQGHCHLLRENGRGQFSQPCLSSLHWCRGDMKVRSKISQSKNQTEIENIENWNCIENTVFRKPTKFPAQWKWDSGMQYRGNEMEWVMLTGYNTNEYNLLRTSWLALLICPIHWDQTYTTKKEFYP